MFGREARLPVDICFGISPDGESEASYHQYVARMKELQSAYQMASAAANKSHLKNKAYYDQRVRDLPLAEGDRILIRNVGLPGRHKLQDRWKSTPYVVVKKLPNLPVYQVKPEQGSGGVKTLHRDHLLPIGYLVRMSNDPVVTTVGRKPVTRGQRGRPRPTTSVVPPLESDPDSSDPEFETACNPQAFDVGEVRRHLSIPHHNPVDSDSQEEESSEVSEEPSAMRAEDTTPSSLESDKEETSNDPAADPDLEGGASSGSTSDTSSEPAVVIRKSERKETSYSLDV